MSCQEKLGGRFTNIVNSLLKNSKLSLVRHNLTPSSRYLYKELYKFKNQF